VFSNSASEATWPVAVAPLRRWITPVSRLRTVRRARRHALTGTPSADPTPYVRARPEYILVEERLVYAQEISRNPSSALERPPSGRILISIPYDGGTCFGPDARDDVIKAVKDGRDADEAVVGHLVFVEHEDSDLTDVLGLAATSGRYRLRVPIRSVDLSAPEMLTSDRFAYRQEITYRPPAEGPKVVPVEVSVDVLDPGHSDGGFLKESVVERVRREPGLRRVMARVIKESAEFEPYLTARIQVRLILPARSASGSVDENPVLRNVRVSLPGSTTLSLAAVGLRHPADGLDDGTDSGDGRLPDDELVQADARGGSFEWLGGPMNIVSSEEDAPRVYESKAVEVRFLQPGELFRQREIRVDVDIELPNELTSGAQVRFFDALGQAPKRGTATPLCVRTIISASCAVLLHDAFEQRRISPSQSFCFDEIVPEKQRVDDVVAALVDQRFRVVRPMRVDRPGKSAAKKRIEYLIIATRRDGPRTMQLWIYVDGRRQPTERESRHPWGHRYRTKFESGTLRIHLRGLVQGDARGVVREINALHISLHERFERMKALR
jgi:hypothetical protein